MGIVTSIGHCIEEEQSHQSTLLQTTERQDGLWFVLVIDLFGDYDSVNFAYQFDPRFTASMVAGFYDQQANTSGTNFAQTGGEQPISTLPTWSSLYFTINGTSYQVGTDASQISNWTQSMSIQTGVVTTAFTWTPSAGVNLTMKYTLFAHRTRPNLGVVRLDVHDIPDGSNVTVTDVLDVNYHSAFMSVLS